MLTKTHVAYALATWLGSGYSKVAPGTAGSLATLPLYWLLRRSHPVVYFSSTVLITAVGVWAAQVVADDLDDKDPSLVVIDEVAGALIALGFVRDRSLASQVAAWLLFRVFDILKPGPIARAEKMKPAGVGIMADDVLAGLVAGTLARWLVR
ncbi:MAG: hypothetical protein RJA70_1898 [Pseudomonadota bacterium]|jgi:phosphatidylglycerophosphatase A